MRLIQDVNVKNKRVFLRVDFNVPVTDGQITDNFRILKAIPTIKHLVESRAKIIIGTHYGRPEGKKSAETSVAPIAKELKKLLNLPVLMATDITGPDVEAMAENLKPGEIMMIENLRWNPGEEADDENFAEELARLAEIYVNDAFAVSHRANASVHALAKILPSYAGLLLQSEVTKLSLLLTNPNPPFVLIIGGVKVKDKAGVIKSLAPKADTILLGGGVASTFLKAKGEDVGESIVDEEMIGECKSMLEIYGNKIVLPTDFVKTATASGSFAMMDIGEVTRSNFRNIIMSAKTVLWNGSLGKSEDPDYQQGMISVAKAMGEIAETTVIAGGDTVGFILEHHLERGISFLSTGGGAALEFLAGDKLPGIEALSNSN